MNHSRTKDAPARRTAIVRTRLELRVAKTFVLELHGRLYEQDYLRVPASEWPDRPEAKHPGWMVLEHTGDFVIAQRLQG